jgi:biopolymer transport protein ExbB
MSQELWHWWAQGDAVTRGTALTLLLMSVISWVLILYKSWFLARAASRVPRAVAGFWSASDLQAACGEVRSLAEPLTLALAQAAAKASPPAGPYEVLAGTARPGLRLTRALRAGLQEGANQLQWGQTMLATLGATAPFVGLLGTVWGIHHALAALAGSGQVGIEELAGPVGEALVMTAAGLAVALPAVLAYNLLGRAAGRLEALLEGFAHDLQAQFGER